MREQHTGGVELGCFDKTEDLKTGQATYNYELYRGDAEISPATACSGEKAMVRPISLTRPSGAVVRRLWASTGCSTCCHWGVRSMARITV